MNNRSQEAELNQLFDEDSRKLMEAQFDDFEVEDE